MDSSPAEPPGKPKGSAKEKELLLHGRAGGLREGDGQVEVTGLFVKPCCADLSECLRSEQVVKEFSSSLYVRGRHLSQMEISFTKGKTGTLFLELLLPLLVFSGLQLKIKLAYFVEAYSGTFQSYMTTLLGDNSEKQLKHSCFII